MLRYRHLVPRTLALLVGPALLFALGCSDDGMGTRYPVSGTVKYKGQPVNKARISFVPAKGTNAGASGDVVDGKFSSLTTLNPGDGVLAGDYKVSVDDREASQELVKSEASKLAKQHGMDGGAPVPPEVQAMALKKAKSTLPGKYQIAETSDLKATVDAGHTTFDFELKD